MGIIRSIYDLTPDQKKVARAAVKILDNVFGYTEFGSGVIARTGSENKTWWFDFYPDRGLVWSSKEEYDEENKTGQSTAIASIYPDEETGDIILEMDGYGSPEVLNVKVNLDSVFF